MASKKKKKSDEIKCMVEWISIMSDGVLSLNYMDTETSISIEKANSDRYR